MRVEPLSSQGSLSVSYLHVPKSIISFGGLEKERPPNLQVTARQRPKSSLPVSPTRHTLESPSNASRYGLALDIFTRHFPPHAAMGYLRSSLQLSVPDAVRRHRYLAICIGNYGEVLLDFVSRSQSPG